jgi:uncharacterized membrane protein YjjP (DUF1212 family)
MIKYQDIRDYLSIIVSPLMVYAIHMLSQALHVYSNVHWLDTPMHFFGGVAIAVSSYYLFKHLENKKELKTIPSFKLFTALSITALAAILWEFHEYAQDLLLQTITQPSIYDTMKDLCMGLLGATVVSVYKYFKKS